MVIGAVGTCLIIANRYREHVLPLERITLFTRLKYPVLITGLTSENFILLFSGIGSDRNEFSGQKKEHLSPSVLLRLTYITLRLQPSKYHSVPVEFSLQTLNITLYKT